MVSKYFDAVLKDDRMNIAMFLFSGVLLGYVLEPVPKFASHLFKNSFLTRTLILIFVGIVTFARPLTQNELITIVVASVAIQLLYSGLRKYDDQLLDMVNGPN